MGVEQSGAGSPEADVPESDADEGDGAIRPRPTASLLSVPPLSVAAAARRAGVAPSTLRTWDRRYGLGPSSHEPGSHRRYTVDDVARLQLMRRLLLEGVSAADAAQVVLATAVPASVAAHLVSRPEGPGEEGGGLSIVPPDPHGPDLGRPDDEPQGDPSLPPVDDPRSSGLVQRVLAAPGARASDVASAVHRAATALDAERVEALLRAELGRRGVVATWDEVVVPVLVQVGNRWAATGRGVEVEHLVSSAVQSALTAHALSARTPDPDAPSVLLASAQDEGHSLPLHALSGALAERVVRSRVLGPRLPRSALAAAVRRTAPAAVFVWSQSRATGDAAAVAEVPSVRPAPLVVLGGPGWWGEVPARAAARTRRVGDLAEAVEVLAAATR